MPELTLSARQHQAIQAPPGPVFVIAGPGAGKTHCLIERIAHHIAAHGARPERICAVTFTNKAAEEIVGRLRARIGPAAADVTVGTLHARAARILRQHAADAGLPIGFGIADEEYQVMLLRRFVAAKHARPLLNRFSRSRFGRLTLDRRDAVIQERYREELARRGMIDFDDLIALTADLFRRLPAIAEAAASRWDWLLVDEFQDLNREQYAIIAALAKRHRRIFAVGDDEQAIYGFQGADPRVIGHFLTDFREADPPIVLEENHRCARHIFETARRVLGPTFLFEKRLVATRESPHPIRTEQFADEHAESDWLIASLAAARAEGLPWGECAVLYRKHRVALTLETRLISAGIPCRLARGHSLADDHVIRFVVAALSVIRAPEDDVAKDAFARCLLRQDLFDELKLLQRRRKLRDVLAAGTAYSRLASEPQPDRRRVWFFCMRLRNLRGIARQHPRLDTLVDDLLAQWVEPHNVLEKHGDRITDPADHAPAAALAGSIGAAVASRLPIVVRLAGGRGIPLATMLLGARLAPSLVGDDEPVPDGALVIDARAPVDGGWGFTLFKALQLHESAALEHAARDYVAFDLETTDLDWKCCGIIEIGAVRVRNGVAVDRFHSLVHTSERIAAGALETHGITAAELEGAPPFPEVWERFRAFVGDDVLYAHNALKFDALVLHRHASGLPGADRLSFYDTLPLVRSLLGASVSLESLARKFGVLERRFHRALDDAEMLVDVVEALQRLKVSRARRIAQVHLLDDLGVAMAMDDPAAWTEEHHVLFRTAAWRTLGPRGLALDRYATERLRHGLEQAMSPEEIVEALGGEAMRERARTYPDAATRYPEAVQRLRTIVRASEGATLADQIQSFLERVALSKSEGTVADRDRVNLLTLHATKGLEFDTVFIAGVEDGQMFGGGREDPGDDEMAESRRLLYVGMTRARNRLALTVVERREGEPGGGSTLLRELGLAASTVSS